MFRVHISVFTLSPASHKYANKTATTLNLETWARAKGQWETYPQLSIADCKDQIYFLFSSCPTDSSQSATIKVYCRSSFARKSFASSRGCGWCQGSQVSGVTEIQQSTLVVCFMRWKKVFRCWTQSRSLWVTHATCPNGQMQDSIQVEDYLQIVLSKDVKDANNYTSLAPKPKWCTIEICELGVRKFKIQPPEYKNQ